MGLCCRNVLTSGFIKLGPSFYLFLLLLLLEFFFKPFCWCVFFLYLNVWNASPRSVFLLGQQAKELCLRYAAILLPSFWYRIFCWWVIYAVVLLVWRPFGHYINRVFLNFSAGNSVLKTVSREWCPSLLVQAVLSTLGSCVCGCTKSLSLTVIWQSCHP